MRRPVRWRQGERIGGEDREVGAVSDGDPSCLVLIARRVRSVSPGSVSPRHTRSGAALM
ncbi:hypothetical protein [Streptomyces sp. NPDC048473]|uniref:hypothetical protein n=1 Tax=unclassified Streptomyces TaxID=2593676 RepID=UPI003710C9B4